MCVCYYACMYVCMYVCMYACIYVWKEGMNVFSCYKLHHGGSMSALVYFPSSIKFMQDHRNNVPNIFSRETKTVCTSFRPFNQLWHEFQSKRKNKNETTDLAQIGIQL